MASVTFEKGDLAEELKRILSEAGQFGLYSANKFKGAWEDGDLIYRRGSTTTIRISPPNILMWLRIDTAKTWKLPIGDVIASWGRNEQGVEIVTIEQSETPPHSLR